MWSSLEELIQALPHPLIEIIIEAVKMDKIIEKKSSVHHAFTKIEGKLDSWRYLWERERTLRATFNVIWCYQVFTCLVLEDEVK